LTQRILIAEDNAFFRKVLYQMIASAGNRYEVVGQAKDGAEAIEAAQKKNPDLLILDLKMPKKDGLEVIASIRKKQQDFKILVLTMSQSKVMLEKALQYGANGYCTKISSRDEIMDAIEQVSQGHTYISPDMHDPD
jgi:DNA-binding NarL/FixJ family response regulator